MGSLLRTTLDASSSLRNKSHIIVPILLLASGLIVAPGQTRIVTTVAGLTHSVSGNGGPASQATVSFTQGMALDAKGNLYFADGTNAQIRKIDASTGEITAVAGTGQIGYSGDRQLAVNSQLNSPEDVAVDAAGNIYIADTDNQIIREVSATTGIITTIAGTPLTATLSGPVGDGGPATKAYLDYPSGVAVDSLGNVFIADSSDQVVREVNASTGIITSVAGKGITGMPGTGNGGPATSAGLLDPVGIAIDASGNLYISEDCDVRKVTATTGIINAYAGNYGSCGYSGDGGPATGADLGGTPGYITLDSAGNLYIADYYNNAVRKVTASTGIITTIAGNGSFGFSGDGGSATYAALNNPKGVAVAGDGSIYISDASNYRIREIAASGVISTIAGNGTSGPISNGQGTSTPLGVYGYRWYDSFVADASGNLYFPDTLNNVIRKLTPGGVISTIVGTGVAGYSGDGGPATSAELNNPAGVTFDAQGNLYIADTENSVVRKVDASTGNISTYAGSYMQYSKAVYSLPSGDGGPATSAVLPSPTGLAVDGAGNLYIAGWVGCAVRKVTPAGIISSYAGQLNNCHDPGTGDGGPATSATLAGFDASIALDSQGNLYIGDTNAVREVTAATGIINTVAGTGSIPWGDPDAGDGGPASSATLSQVYGLATDPGGNLYIADDYAIRVVNTKGIISTAAGLGNGWGYTGDGGLATSAYISPEGVAADASGNIYFIDADGNRIRKVSAGSVQPAAATPEFSPAPGDFTSNPTVTITTTTPGEQIFYTLDGSVPNPGWDAMLYTGPISLVAPVTLTAFTVAPGYSTSATASGIYSTGQKSQTITFGGLSNVTYGVAPIALGATASSGLAVTYTVTGPATVSGSTLNVTGAGTITVTANQIGNSVYLPASPVSQSFTSAKGAITVTAADATMPFGGPMPALTYIINGFANGDNLDSLSGSFSEATTATITSFPGTYPITFSTEGLSSPNYTFTYVNGTLTITPAAGPVAFLSPSSLSFSSQAVGSTSAAQTITLTNAGNAALIIGSISASANFAETNTCATSVTVGGNCTISVTFAPTTGGALTGTVTITGGANNLPQTIALAGTGSNVSVATTSTGMTTSSGGSTTASIQASSAGGFSGTVNFACAVAYQGSGTPHDPPTCSLNPKQGQVSTGTQATTTLTVNTTASSASLNNPWLPFGGGGALAAFLLLLCVPRSRRYGLGLIVVVALIMGGATLGCGGGNSTTSSPSGGGSSNPGTTSGNYVVTVTATSAADATQTMSLTIPLLVQ